MRLLIFFALACTQTKSQIITKNDQNAPGMQNYGNLTTGQILKMIRNEIIDPSASSINNFIRDISLNLNVSEECITSIGTLQSGLLNSSLWAIQMLDATAKLPAGLLEGSLSILGSYDECMEIKVRTSNDFFWGQYCTVRLTPTKELIDIFTKFTQSETAKSFLPIGAALSFRWDICIPSTCMAADIVKVLNSTFSEKRKQLIIPAVTGCQISSKEITLNGGEITSIVIFSILGLLLIGGSTLDIFLRLMIHFDFKNSTATVLKELTLAKFFLSFSVYTNGTKLLSTDMPKGSLTAINGVRFLSMSWVIIGHSYYFINTSIVGNLRHAIDLAYSFPFQAILNGTLSVDSFFLLSGLLVAFVALNGLRQNGSMNWGLYYFHRIWRLTPAYALVITFTFLWPLLGSGPTWYENNAAIVTNCETHWWTALLYIGNLYQPEKMCLSHGWYLANDMQFYAVSPILLILLYKKPKIGLVVNFLLLLATLITTGLLGYEKNLPPTTLYFEQNQTGDFFQSVYIKPYCRMGPYCIGLYVGYFLSSNRKLNMKLRYHAILWSLSIACNMSVLYGVYEWNKGFRSSRAVNAFYLSTHRTAWSLGLAWVIIACSTGHGGIVNSILSWKPFAPLGRMTYCAYLIHPMIQLAYSGLIRERIIYTHYTWVTMSLGFVLSSYAFAFATTLAIEAPFLGLEKLFLRKPTKKTTSKLQEVSNENAIESGLKPDSYTNKAFKNDKTEL